jgi:hypothetical protein
VSHTPPVVDYARAFVAPDQIEVRTEGDSVVVIIPPPPLLRFVSHAVVWGFVVSVVLAAGFVIFVAAISDSGGQLSAGKLATTACAGLVVGGLLTIVRVLQAVAMGNLAGTIRISDHDMEVRSPAAFAIRSRRWPAASVRDVAVGEAGAMGAFVVLVRLQIIFDDERVEQLRLPWNGNGSLALMENRLREALHLSPPAALTV